MDYKLITIRDGIEPSIIVVNGFLSENTNDVNDWLEIIDELYPENRVLHYKWPSNKVKDLFGLHGKLAATLSILARSNPSLVALGIARDSIKSWASAMNNSINAGRRLAELISEETNGYIFMGHSLGARVSFHALLNAQELASIEKIYLLGGAVSNTAPWTKAIEKHPNLQIINCFSSNDYVLKSLYKIGTLFSNKPVGLEGIQNSKTSLIYNVDLSELVKGHMDYKNSKVGRTIKNRTEVSINSGSRVKAFYVSVRKRDLILSIFRR
ncbi:DUF726 domain-containing protein [Vibrio sp. Vb2531]|uniref:DUF726 domain-containing protein n=1 Tax=Vibrio sp. Vb2531 TaxID=3074665 RepID=UPI002963D717|nr:DUF726 domain-containing protein [Vibrio sp. Vb2531]MDW1743436.1 DUF726 domain-containing protein [Vibrio sp. Vb2531]